MKTRRQLYGWKPERLSSTGVCAAKRRREKKKLSDDDGNDDDGNRENVYQLERK